jgi:tetratricopeptide (TPR) repeat protein
MLNLRLSTGDSPIMGATPQDASSDPPYYPRGGTYADYLEWHLFYWGTREDGDTTVNGQVWLANKFVEKAFAARGFDAGRTGLRNWLGRAKPPNSGPDERNHEQIKTAIFGKNPNFHNWQKDLDDSRERSTLGRNRRTKKFPDPPPIPASNKSTAAVIPRLTPYFIGRDDERDRLVAAILSDGEALNAFLIQGGPGMGKTELTKAIAHHKAVVQHFGERRWFIRLETSTTTDEMQQAIARGLGCDPKDDFQAILEFLGAGPNLLILDNLETPWESTVVRRSTEEVLAALAAIVGLTLLVSFRGVEKVGGPRWYEHSLDELSPKAAIELFQSISGIWIESDSHGSHFMSALGGIPLAIQLVARRAYGCTTLAMLWQEWQRIGTALAADTDFEAGRLTSLSHSIELSLQSPRLNEEAWRLLRILGALPNGLANDDVAELISQSSFKACERLRNTGLSYETLHRVDLLPPIRDYIMRSYEPALDDIIVITNMYFSRLKSLSEEPSLYCHALRSILLEYEIANIKESFLIALKFDTLSKALEAMNGFEGQWTGCSPLIPVIDIINYKLLRKDDIEGQAKCMVAKANCLRSEYEDEDVYVDLYYNALKIFRELDNKDFIASIQSRLGLHYYAKRKYDIAERNLIESIENSKRRSLYYWDAVSNFTLGQLYAECDKLDDSIKSFNSALDAFERTADFNGRNACILELADAHQRTGDKCAARTFCEIAVNMLCDYASKEAKDSPYAIDTEDVAIRLDFVSAIAHHCKDEITAQRALDNADSLYARLGKRRYQPPQLRTSRSAL